MRIFILAFFIVAISLGTTHPLPTQLGNCVKGMECPPKDSPNSGETEPFDPKNTLVLEFLATERKLKLIPDKLMAWAQEIEEMKEAMKKQMQKVDEENSQANGIGERTNEIYREFSTTIQGIMALKKTMDDANEKQAASRPRYKID